MQALRTQCQTDPEQRNEDEENDDDRRAPSPDRVAAEEAAPPPITNATVTKTRKMRIKQSVVSQYGLRLAAR